MKQYRLLIFTFGFIAFSSCTITKPLTSVVKPIEVTDLQCIEPFSYISLIEKGNRTKYNEALSRESKQLLIKVSNNYKDQIPIKGEIFVADTIVKRKLENEIKFLCLTADRQRSIQNIKLTPVIDSLVELTGNRFGLITVSTGFTRAKGNYGGQVAKGAAMGILTLGMYYQTPIKSYSTVYAMIVDAKENNIAFYRKSFLQDKNPLDEAVLMKQFQKIFEGYFWTKK
jgi:hypothetical protein